MQKRILIAGAVVVALMLVAGAAFVASTWGDVKRVTIDRPTPPGVVAAAEPDTPEGEDPDPEPGLAVPPSADGVDVFLLVGSDSRDTLQDLEGFGEFGGQRADVVMLLIRPRDGSTAAVMSLPRDLLVDNVCGSAEHRLNEALEGCGDSFNGPTALTLTVDHLIDLPVDHFALVDLAGFQGVVDAIGGYQICLELPVRDLHANLELPAGCTLANGEQTLAWMRSRRTQELTASGWKTIPGVNDLTRNERQRDFMIDMMSQLSDITSPQSMAAVAQTVAPYITVDAGLSFMDAVGLAWTMRGLGTSSIITLDVPVADATTSNGASVLIPTLDIADLVASYLNPETAARAALAIAP